MNRWLAGPLVGRRHARRWAGRANGSGTTTGTNACPTPCRDPIQIDLTEVYVCMYVCTLEQHVDVFWERAILRARGRVWREGCSRRGTKRVAGRVHGVHGSICSGRVKFGMPGSEWMSQAISARGGEMPCNPVVEPSGPSASAWAARRPVATLPRYLRLLRYAESSPLVT